MTKNGPFVDESQARKDLIEVSRLCYERGYICGTEGNFSVKLAANRVLTTPAGTCKGRITEKDLVVTDAKGEPVKFDEGRKPSTELKMHLTAYDQRPDVKAVVHAHPTTAVAFTVAGLTLDQCVLPEVVCTLGNIPVAPYATPSTDEIPASIIDIVKDHDALVLDHHGALTLADKIWDAYYKLETLEHFAQTMMIAHVLGGVKPLKSSQVKKLLAICSNYGLKQPANAKQLISAQCSIPDGE